MPPVPWPLPPVPPEWPFPPLPLPVLPTFEVPKPLGISRSVNLSPEPDSNKREGARAPAKQKPFHSS